jgi:LysW-gamma-L-lysine carboxypeptidase
MDDLEAIHLLESMLRIPSVSYEEGALANFLAQSMTELGFDAEVDAAGNAVGIIGEGPVTGVLLGHIDTVPGNIPVRVEEGRLYGRGAVDAKGPMAAFIAAAARVARSGSEGLRLILVGCVEEEAPSSKGARYVLPLYRPDFCVVGEPSGWDRITLGYKGTLRLRLHFEQPSAHTAHQGPTVGERTVEAWNNIVASAATFNAGRERIFDQLLTALISLQTASDGRYDWADLDCNFRLPTDLSPEQAEVLVAEAAPNCMRFVMGSVPAWAGPRTTPLHRAMARSVRAQGGSAQFVVKTGTADLNLVAPAWGCPALAYGPGDAALDHTPDEHILLDEYLRGVAVLEGALAYCAQVFAPNEGHPLPPASGYPYPAV